MLAKNRKGPDALLHFVVCSVVSIVSSQRSFTHDLALKGIVMRKAVCSWSLRPENTDDLVVQVQDTGVNSIQLALDPIRRANNAFEELRVIQSAGISVVSGMMEMIGEDYSTFDSIRKTGGVRPDETWEMNVESAKSNALLAQQVGLSLVTFHAGFIPHDDTDPERGQMLERLSTIADIFSAQGCDIALETGQETADTLVEVLSDLGREDVGVNFDPANMILYGMGDPIQALDRLAPWVKQIHIKDALGADSPGVWGTEVPAGDGAVEWDNFFELLSSHSLDVDLVIEREAGEERVRDVRVASDRIDQWLSKRDRGMA